MFELEYKGGNTVVMTSKKASLVFDPKLSLLGQKDAKPKDAILIGTEDRFIVHDPEARVVINGPGEYEVADFTIRGIATSRHIDAPEDEKRATMYRVECGDLRIGVLGNIDPKLSDEQYEMLGMLDILVLPIGGGGYTLDATSAAGLVRSIEPKVVIPVHYADVGLDYEVPQDSLETFTKELAAPVESVAKLKIKNTTSLPAVLTVFEVTRS